MVCTKASFIEPMLLLRTDHLPDDSARWSYHERLRLSLDQLNAARFPCLHVVLPPPALWAAAGNRAHGAKMVASITGIWLGTGTVDLDRELAYAFRSDVPVHRVPVTSSEGWRGF